jgi:dihydrofolate reductase
LQKTPKNIDEMDTTLSAIVAIDAHGAIGRNGQLLCHLPADLKHFKAITTGHSIIMGRKTFESFPRGPLPGRQNIVVTRNAHYRPQGVTVAHSIDQAIALVEMPGEAFIIGGGTLYKATIGLVSTLHLTRIEAAFAEADTFFRTSTPPSGLSPARSITRPTSATPTPTPSSPSAASNHRPQVQKKSDRVDIAKLRTARNNT